MRPQTSAFAAHSTACPRWSTCSRLRRCRQTLHVTANQTNGNVPTGAFTPGKEAEARQRLFNNIAPIYDQLNDVLSLGQHRVWKKMAVEWSGVRDGQRALDVCCGSGDLALLLAKAVGREGEVVGLDFAAEMLSDAAQRQQRKQALSGRRLNVQWVQGDALQLPFEDGSFQAATMGYGLRNVASIPTALRELHRVLQPGSKVAILDFNNASQSNPGAAAFQGWALESLVVPVARAYGLEQEYAYLAPSIAAFPTGQEQERLAREAGFTLAKHYEVGFGLMGVLVAVK